MISIQTHIHRYTKHTSARCCGRLTLISAALVRTLSSVSTTFVSLGDDQQRRQECLRKEDREHSFFQSSLPPSCPPSQDSSIFSCCPDDSSIAALAQLLHCRGGGAASVNVCVCPWWAVHSGRMHQCKNGKTEGDESNREGKRLNE